MLVDHLGNAWAEHHRALAHRLRVLVVEDDPGAGEVLQCALTEGGFDVSLAQTAEAAWERLQQESYGLLVADDGLPGMTGLELIERTRAQGIDLAPVVVTGQSTIEVISAALSAGAVDYIPKPVPPAIQLVGRLRSIVLRQIHEQFYASLVRELSAAVTSGGDDKRLITGVARDLFLYKRALRKRTAVLVADPEPIEAEVITDVLTSAGLSVTPVVDPEQALRGLAPPYAALTAVIHLNLADAVPLVRDLRLRDGPLGVIALSGVGQRAQVLEALEAGAHDAVDLAQEGFDVLSTRVVRAVDNVRREYLYAHLIATLYVHVKSKAPERAATLLDMLPEGHRHYIQRMPPIDARESVSCSADDVGNVEVELASVLEPHRDRRAHTRLLYTVPATVRIEGQSQLYPCHTRDVSESGLFLHSPHLPQRQGVLVNVTLEGERRLQIAGEVVRYVHVHPDPMHLSGWGVRVLNPAASGYAAMVQELLADGELRIL